MDVREKLVELANDVLRYLPWGEIQKDTAERIADRMMDHGVTVREWILVKDRLPAVGEDVLVVTSSSDRNMAVWRLFGNAANRQAHWEDEVGDGLILGAATHWMPLPQPPKGE